MVLEWLRVITGCLEWGGFFFFETFVHSLVFSWTLLAAWLTRGEFRGSSSSAWSAQLDAVGFFGGSTVSLEGRGCVGCWTGSLLISSVGVSFKMWDEILLFSSSGVPFGRFGSLQINWWLEFAPIHQVGFRWFFLSLFFSGNFLQLMAKCPVS